MIKMPNIIHITKADDLSISNNQLVMIDEDNNDEKNKISLNDISAIVIENCHCKISAILQLRLVENNIPIIICNERHQPEIHSLGLFNHFQVTLRINEQIEWEKEKKEKLWSRIVENKIENQRALLEYLEKSDKYNDKFSSYFNNIVYNRKVGKKKEAEKIYNKLRKEFKDKPLIDLADIFLEAMAGDVIFDKKLQRTIVVDIRYVLWCIDTFGGAKHIVDEMTIIQ